MNRDLIRAWCCVCITLAVYTGVLAAPPNVEFPRETKAVGDYVTIQPKTDAKGITYIGLSGVDPFPSAFLKDSRSFVLPVRGLPEGKYLFKGVATLNDEPTTFDFWVQVGEGKNDPVPPIPPKPVPPVPPIPDVVKVDKVFVVLVEDAHATRTLETGKLLNDPYWETLKPKNDWRHYRSDSQTAITNGYVAEAEKIGVGYPAVIVIDPATSKVLTSFKCTSVAKLKETINSLVK